MLTLPYIAYDHSTEAILKFFGYEGEDVKILELAMTPCYFDVTLYFRESKRLEYTRVRVSHTGEWTQVCL